MSETAAPKGGYHAPLAPSGGELREQGSRFLALLEPIASEEAARARVAAIARDHAGATHCCFAWRIGEPALERSSDAGEPAGTAGPPILRVLRGRHLSDALLVVVRWFGGVKLGKGGLARAYAAAALAAAEAARLEPRAPSRLLRVVAAYGAVGAVQRLLHPPYVVLREATYGERAELWLEVHADQLEALREALSDLKVDHAEPSQSAGASRAKAR